MIKRKQYKNNQLLSSGSMITGLAAQANNATVLFKLITSIVGESVSPIVCGIPMFAAE